MHRNELVHRINGINGLLGVLGWNTGYRAALGEDVAGELIAAELVNSTLRVGPRPSVVLGKAETGRVDVAVLVCDGGNGIVVVVVLEGDVNLLSRLLGLFLSAALLHSLVLGRDRDNLVPDSGKIVDRLTGNGATALPVNGPGAQELLTCRGIVLSKITHNTRIIGHLPIAVVGTIDVHRDARGCRLRCSRAVVALSKGRGHRAHYRAQGQHSPQACCDCDVFAVELHAAIPPCSLLKRQTFLEGGHIVGKEQPGAVYGNSEIGA